MRNILHAQRQDCMQFPGRACPTKCFGYGEVVDVYLQAKRDGAAVKRFFKDRCSALSRSRESAFEEWNRAVA
jgi:hypothetical protein